MSLVRKPTAAEIKKFLDRQRVEDFSYSDVGDTQTGPPVSFDVDRNRILLGRGAADFDAACEALRQWQMFPRGWTELVPANAEQREGVTLAMLARCFGKWWLNACRIVYVVDDRHPHRRIGFAYGTLPGHVECGEERFLIEWDDEDQVWYEIYSFSRPRHWLVKLCYPLARRLQKRFVKQSLAQMQMIVAACGCEPRNQSPLPKHACQHE
ncbi:MAG: DUF1990 family protein [Bythopirellula sp.]